jgi:uncharacterized GH25 family protein
MHRKLLSLLFVTLITFVTIAHEFWLEPVNFFYHVGETLSVAFKVGENFVGEPWITTNEKVEKLEIHHLNSVADLRASLKEDPKENLSYTLHEEGTHMIVLQSKNSFIELEAEKFNTYLKEEGLDDPYYEREKSNTLTKPGKENYARFSKLLIQVGGKRDDTYKKVVGLPIEIIPLQNPYSLRVGDLMQFKIFFNGKPLFGAKVVFWNRQSNRTIVQPVYTLQDGTVEDHISNTGMWMVSVVKMVPCKDGTADWQSYWGSLTFGVH